VKVLATSDLHGRLPAIEPCDLLIIAGDICPDYNIRDRLDSAVEQGRWLNTVFRRWLADIPATSVIAIAGNHDFVFENEAFVPDLPWVYLRDEGVSWEGHFIYGLPWVPNLKRWAFYGDSLALRAVYEAVPEYADIVVSHGPPLHVADHVGPQFGDIDVGCIEANMMLHRVKPRAFLCGHIHEEYGWHEHKTTSTPVVNLSHVNTDYEPVNPVVDITEFFDA